VGSPAHSCSLGSGKHHPTCDRTAVDEVVDGGRRRREYRERGQSVGEGKSDCAEARMTKRWSWTSVRRGNAEWRIGARMERDNRSVGTSIRRQAWRTRGRGFPLLPTSKQPPAALPPSHHHHCHCHHHHALSKNSGHRADLSHR
jgi:hypothetical protein